MRITVIGPAEEIKGLSSPRGFLSLPPRSKYKTLAVIKENIYDEQNSEGIIDSLFVQQDNDEVMEEEPVKSEHTVDPDDFALYKKYLS